MALTNQSPKPKSKPSWDTRVQGQVVDTFKGMPRKIASKELNAYFAATLQAAGHGLAASASRCSTSTRTPRRASPKPCSCCRWTQTFSKRSCACSSTSTYCTKTISPTISSRCARCSAPTSCSTTTRSSSAHSTCSWRAASLYDNKEDVIQCYEALSAKVYTHATPRFFNAGMKKGQYARASSASCRTTASWASSTPSSSARSSPKQQEASGYPSPTSATRTHQAMGKSNGNVPMLRGVQRNGALRRSRQATQRFLLRHVHRTVARRHRSLSRTAQKPRRLKTQKQETCSRHYGCRIFLCKGSRRTRCGRSAPKVVNLQDVHSEAFNKRYEHAEANEENAYEQETCGRKSSAQIETGTPYMVYKDR